ncbi:hypothetical protein GCM10008014_41400 [Paenibacillus silvae]|uniref:DUF11 domain-containing protein n=1 Tax=Paenibacillus silvae TaxID=1325358 RepID=A0ABQ1ZGS3_9BACL|nr:hypothetical protein [Paenibacillus silvae]GGH63721.1 hypothetical protein GCM10008014_41400 [Paenibacillus silvae]
MACNQNSKTKVSFVTPATAPSQLVGTKAKTDTRFVISDNHETIDETTIFTNGYCTLWSDTASGKTSVKYRMFVWHLNNRGASMKYGITIGNNNTSAYSIHNVKSTIAPITSFVEQGRCTAAALVGDTMDTITPTDSSIPAGKLGVVKEWTVPNGQLIGGLIEFTVTNTASTAMSYRLRSVAAASATADLRLNQTPVISFFTGKDGSIHPRGSWDFAEIASSVNYSAGSGWKYYNMSNGQSDNLMTKAASYDNGNAADSNKGHYGVKYTLTVNLTNPTSAEKTISIYMGSRVKPYGGAVKWSGDNVTYKVPNLASPPTLVSGTTQYQEGILVAEVKLSAGQSITRTITAASAGGLSTPAVVAFQTK